MTLGRMQGYWQLSGGIRHDRSNNRDEFQSGLRIPHTPQILVCVCDEFVMYLSCVCAVWE